MNTGDIVRITDGFFVEWASGDKLSRYNGLDFKKENWHILLTDCKIPRKKGMWDSGLGPDYLDTIVQGVDRGLYWKNLYISYT